MIDYGSASLWIAFRGSPDFLRGALAMEPAIAIHVANLRNQEIAGTMSRIGKVEFPVLIAVMAYRHMRHVQRKKRISDTLTLQPRGVG